MRQVIRATVFITVAGLSLVTKFSTQAAVAEDTRAQMLDICAVDHTCIQVVDTYFKRCFKTHYNLDSLNSSTRLDMDGLAACVNDYGKAEYFVLE